MGKSTTLEARSAEVRSAFAANYRPYQYKFVEFFVDHLSDLSRTFGGDLQQMVVIAIVGQVYMRAMHDAAAAGRDPTDLPPERTSITASRIADVTGIPRQTVRRKLTSLEKRGWIERSPASAWRLVVNRQEAAARVDLRDSDQRAITRVARLFAELETLVKVPAGRD